MTSNCVCNLYDCFPDCHYNDENVLILDDFSLVGIKLDAETKANLRDHDLRAIVLSTLARETYKTNPYPDKALNDEYHEKMLTGVNKFLSTTLTVDDMKIIDEAFGGGKDHEQCVRFIIDGCHTQGLFVI